MCGIFGYFSIPGGGEELLRKMAEQQIHRGPDSEGFYTDRVFGFGIRRLSVIDLVTGNQPIHNEDKTVWVVCNGEIYNYLELNGDLKARGHRFCTNSDVECIVHLYEEQGIDCLKQLNGMFGLALYDHDQQTLYIARDRLGIKPLYYAHQQDSLLFSSELRSLLATNRVSRDLDWQAISFFLDQLYIPTPYSPFRDISKIRPGHYLRISKDHSLSESSYWRLEDTPSVSIPTSEEEAVDLLTDLLKDSNRLQLRADVPVCAFLSGGIDSSAVVAFASMASSVPLRTYHVFFENNSKKMDERQHARSVAERYGTIHSEVSVGRNDFHRLIPMLLWHLEEPFGDLASVPTYIISEMARKEVTVCLNGSGGDELFAGYQHHSRLHWLRQRAFSATGKLGLDEGMIRSMMGKANSSTSWLRLFPRYVLESGRVMPEDKGKTFPGDCVNRIMAKDIDGYLQSNVLFLLDKIAMAVSLEGRVPLLDHRFVEVAAHLPSKWKYNKGERKYLLKKMLRPYLPNEVLDREKEGFGAPLTDWLDQRTKTTLVEIIQNGSMRKNGLLTDRDDLILGFSAWDLWKVACLEIWYRIMVVQSSCPRGVSLENLL